MLFAPSTICQVKVHFSSFITVRIPRMGKAMFSVYLFVHQGGPAFLSREGGGTLVSGRMSIPGGGGVTPVS